MPARILLLVGLAVVAAEFGSPARGSAAEARMYFSRRGPTTEGCLGPTAGEVPDVYMPGGGTATLHLWLNVDGLPENDTFGELGWGVESTSAYSYAPPYTPLLGSKISNPVNPNAAATRWDFTRDAPATFPFVVYRAGGVSLSSPSIGTTATAHLDPGYDAASNSFHLGSITVEQFDFGAAQYFLRNGRLTELKSGEPIDLLFGHSDLPHSGAMPDAGDPITGGDTDAWLFALGRPTELGIYPVYAGILPEERIERRIDLADGPGNAAYCARGEWYSHVAVDNYRKDALEIYVDFASVSGAEVAERLLWSFGSLGEEAIDVSGTYPLHNGIDYDVKIRYAGPPPGESFVLSFDTEFDFPGYPIANIGIVPEPSSVLLAAIGVAAAALAYRRRIVRS